MSLSDQPCARQIVDLTEGNKITPSKDVLREILFQTDIKDKQVCVVSITGTFRQGKSFLLNFFIRYLTLRYKVKKDQFSDKWLDASDGNISGFDWRCGSDRHTVGILMWSEIFIAELPSGEQIAIVLLDTQGTFDTETTKQHCAGIFAISTLISSVQIYNLKNKITQFDLEHLECFSGYGQLALNQKSKCNDRPFQSLCFLIRDWPYQFQKSFGASGGQELLQEVFTDADQPLALKKQIDNIQNLFEKITCFLMPFPGQTVASDPSFQGKLEDVDPIFVKYVEEFVPTILAPENLVPKVVNGEKIKVSDLYHFIQNYCESFMKQDVPQLSTMFMATAEAHCQIASEESLDLYKDSMENLVSSSDALDELDLLDMHNEQKTKAIDHFTSKKIFGKEALKRIYVKSLDHKLEEVFLDYAKLNKTKLDKEIELNRQKQHHQVLTLEQEREMEDYFKKNYDLQEAEIKKTIASTKLALQECQRSNECDRMQLLQSRIDKVLEPLPEVPTHKSRNLFKIFWDWIMDNYNDKGNCKIHSASVVLSPKTKAPDDNTNTYLMSKQTSCKYDAHKKPGYT